jgi:nitrite reductase/ring-hydroxylating ferredoxin subunit
MLMGSEPPVMFLDDDICGPPPGTILANIGDIPKHGGKTIDFRTADGHSLSIFIQRSEGEFEVYQNRCPHAGTPLNLLNERFMDLDNKYLLCRTHGAKFDFASGKCVSGPCKGKYLRKVAFHIEADNIVSR